MHWRPFREADLSFCLEMQPSCLGAELVGRAAALKAWRSLVQHPAFLATVIESERPIGRGTIAGCGMGVFVRAAFAEREIREPRPGLNARIIAKVSAAVSPGASAVLLSRDEIGQGNAGGGLDFVNLYGTWQAGALQPAELTEVQGLLGTGFAEQFAGYRFHRVLKEAIGEDQVSFARSTGTYRVVAEYANSALVVVTPETARSAPYSMAASIYRYRAPELRLRPAEQELLAAALNGSTDAELSQELGLSVESTKKRWLSVFDRVGRYKPEILAEPSTEKEGRGQQKRHRIVAYVRQHPEELRPYFWR